jgi:hypothetical protein
LGAPITYFESLTREGTFGGYHAAREGSRQVEIITQEICEIDAVDSIVTVNVIHDEETGNLGSEHNS